MRVKLIQRGIVDSAESVQRLDFSALSGRKDWSIVVDFGDGDKLIARVCWAYSHAYSICTDWKGRHDSGIIHYHSHIIPTVICRLTRLFHLGQITDARKPQPIVTVMPFNA